MSDNKQTSINYSCQRCLQPLELDESFKRMNEHDNAELSLPVNSYSNVDLESQAPSFDQYVPTFHVSDTGNTFNGFTIISNTGNEVDKFSYMVKLRSDLFDALSTYSTIDHPLCDECTDTLLDMLEQQLKTTQDDWNTYNEFLKKLETEKVDMNLDSMKKKLSDLKDEEERLTMELRELEMEERAKIESIEQARAERDRLMQEEERYWNEYAKLKRDVLQCEDESKSLECQTNYAHAQLEKFKQTNIFNETFNIWFMGYLSTINGFRLGRLGSVPVDWSEINCAWGQCALLLASLARKMNFTFEKYRVVPYGNHSFIQVLADNRELPLHANGSVLSLLNTKFDEAMYAFVNCQDQFSQFLHSIDKSFMLPYTNPSNKGEYTLGEKKLFYVKTKLISEEERAKVLKYMLTNMKWILLWVAAQFNIERKNTREWEKNV